MIIPAAPDDWGAQVSNANKFNNISKGLLKAKERVQSGENVSDVDVNGVPLQETIDTTNLISGAAGQLGLLGLGSIESAITQSSLFGAQNLEFDACNNRTRNPNTQDDVTPAPPGFIYPKCLPPVVKIFGPGTGAEVLPIVGNDNRIFSIEVINGGSGYDETTGLVVVDNTGNGKGAFARPLVVDGVIEKVVLIKTGYGYCVNTSEVETEESVGIGTNVVGIIDNIFIETPGYNYSPDDTVKINNVDFPIITSPTGAVVSVNIPPNYTTEYNRFPSARLNTATGIGAKVIPIMSFTPQFKTDVTAEERRVKPLIGIERVIDCIGDNKEVVGYVNGVAYSGPYHVMSNGLKMTGATHSGSDSIIYDTMEDVTEQTTPTTPTTPTTTTDTSSGSSDTSTPPSTPSDGGGYGGGY